MINNNMLAMKPGDRFTCPAVVRLPGPTTSTYYRLYMAKSWTFMNMPETNDLQVSCNTAKAMVDHLDVIL